MGLLRRTPRLGRLLVLLAPLACALIASGCGGGSSSSPVDPASAIPPSVPIYAGADVRPSGAEKSAALSVGQALSKQSDPYLRLLSILQTPGSPALDFNRDVAPWLGPKAGLFLTSTKGAEGLLPIVQSGLLGTALPAGASGFPFGPGGAQGAIVMDTTDVGKARAFLQKQGTRRSAAPSSSFDGVTYGLNPEGIAFGIVDRFAVIGSVTGMNAVIEADRSPASSLLHSAGYAKLANAAPPGAIAHLYYTPGSASATGVLSATLTGGQANVSLVPASGSLSAYIDTTAGAGGLLSSPSEAAAALDNLPGDSWLAVGFGHLSSELPADVGQLSGVGGLLGSLGGGGSSGGALSLTGLLKGLLAPLQVLSANTPQAQAAFRNWMGSGALFASGTGLLELKGAVVIESSNPPLSRAAVGRMAAALGHAGIGTTPTSIPGADAAITAKVPGLPLELEIANGRSSSGRDLFVLGLGQASVTEALSPSSKLAGAESLSTASRALGEGIRPSAFVNLPTLLGLLEGVGLTEDPSLAKVLPYLRSVGAIAAGGHPLPGGVQRFKLALGLR